MILQRLFQNTVQKKNAKHVTAFLDAPHSLLGKAHNLPFHLQENLKQLLNDGFTVLKSCVPEFIVDQVLSEFSDFTEQNPAGPEFVNEHGLHSRLCNFHSVSEGARRIAFNPDVLRLLDFLFQVEAAPYTSLYFQRGSGQQLHRDCPFFVTNPRNLFFGVWTALEDINPQAGPLIYVLGSHTFNINEREIYRAQKKSKNPIGNAFSEYLKEIADNVSYLRLSTARAIVKKGDTIIWHFQLVHGGDNIKNPALSRNSIVFHYAPYKYPMAGVEVFFGKEPFPKKAIPGYERHENRYYQRNGSPFFAKNV